MTRLSNEENYQNKICTICREEFEGYGNNPEPIKDEGQCCDSCNLNYVIPKRMGELP